MSSQPVRDAYSYMSERYIALFGVDWQAPADDAAFVRGHLVGIGGTVLDLGCGPGHWSGYLHSLGADVTGVDLVPEFLDYARTHFPGPAFRLGSMTELGLPDHAVTGILSWYSTIHLPPAELDGVLIEFRRMLAPSGVLVIGFFDSDDGVAAFDHKVQYGIPLAGRRVLRPPDQSRFHRTSAIEAPSPGAPRPQVRGHCRHSRCDVIANLTVNQPPGRRADLNRARPTELEVTLRSGADRGYLFTGRATAARPGLVEVAGEIARRRP